MNEILKAKKLTEEILARAAAIKTHMEDCNARMDAMQRIEEQAKARASKVSPAEATTAPQLQLLDLPNDLLGNVAKALRNYDAMVAFSRVKEDGGRWDQGREGGRGFISG